MRTITPNQICELRKRLPTGRVLALESDRSLYSHDLGTIPKYLKVLLFRFTPSCVVQPASEEEAVEVVRFCTSERIPVITRTVASSGFANVIPTTGEVVIDLGFLNRIVDLDSAVPSITVQAGTKWAQVDALLTAQRLALHTYPSSYYSSVGGWVATGGLGVNSLRFGHLKNHVLSLRVILPTGEVKDLSPTDPWFDRFFGTEGQFGLIMRVSLKVREQPRGTFPVLLSFEEEQEAFRWVSALMENGGDPSHIKFMDRPILEEINRFYGESLIEARPSVLAVFGERIDQDKLPPSSGRKAPEYLARFFWHEQLFPLRMSRLGSSLLASETLLEDRAVPEYVEGIRRLTRRLGFDLLLEAHGVGPHRILLMPHFLCEPTRSLRYLLALVLTSLLTQMAVNEGGEPYGLGIWNSPFIRSKFDVQSLSALIRWKDQIDPGHLFNPCRYFRVRTRFFNIPGLVFGPSVFRFLMRVLIAVSPLWAWVGRLLTSRKETPLRDLTAMERAAMLCSRCGSCLAVCPAYLVRRDEALVARSKLRLVDRLARGESLSSEEANKVFLCLHCHACERVCQSRIELVRAWEELEKTVASKYGTPVDNIAEFIKDVDESDEYQRMVDNW